MTVKFSHTQLLFTLVCALGVVWLGNESPTANPENQKYLERTGKRYSKGLEIIRSMYEKTLELDHHFSSLDNFGDITELANPTAYPEYEALRAQVDRRLRQRDRMEIPMRLQANPYIGGVFTLLSSVLGEGDPGEKHEELERLSCILDFTVRLRSDVNLIHYETEFLRRGNEELNRQLIELYENYAATVGYRVPLPQCRDNDDWHVIHESTRRVIGQMQTDFASGDERLINKVYRQQINMEFEVDKLIEFLDDYDNFVRQGEKYYDKFHLILSKYERDQDCQQQLPEKFRDLEKTVELASRKFNEAYRVAEISGSRLKDMLFGYEEFTDE